MIHPQQSHLRILRSLKIKYLKGFTTKKIDKFSINNKKNKSIIYKSYIREKKKLCFFYYITKKQLINYIKKAKKLNGFTSIILFQLLEMRLDTIIFRFGLTPTIISARQLISHGHIYLNSNLITIPSFLCFPGDIIKINMKKGYKVIFNFMKLETLKSTTKKIFKSNLIDKSTNFSHLKFDKLKNIGYILNFPQKIDYHTFINYFYILNKYKNCTKLKKKN